MNRRKWENKEKLKIVLEGLKGRSVASICNEYQIAQSQYYKWRDLFFDNADTVFDITAKTKKENRQDAEIKKLKQVIGDLTMELKKNDW